MNTKKNKSKLDESRIAKSNQPSLLLTSVTTRLTSVLMAIVCLWLVLGQIL